MGKIGGSPAVEGGDDLFGEAVELVAGRFKRAVGIAKGSGEPNKNKVGKITPKQVEEIARMKLPDLNAESLEAAIQTVRGTARSMGVEVG